MAKRLRFVVSLMTKNNDYQLEQAASAQETSHKLGVDIQIIYAENDPISQSTQLLRVIQSAPESRPDGIVFEPAGGTAFPQAAQAAVNAKIAWGVLNREADYLPDLRKTTDVPVFLVSSDHKEIGRIQSRQFAALLPNGGNLLYIQGPSDSSAAKDRTAGMQMTLPSNIRVTNLRAQWTEESAQRSVESWLKLNTSHKLQIDVVGAQNDVMAVGAQKAFGDVADPTERHRWLSLPYTGVDGLPKTGQAWVRTGGLAATVAVPPNTGQALSMLVEALQTGRRLPERTFTVAESFPPIEKLAGRKSILIPTA